MKQIFFKKGNIVVEETPFPEFDENHALIRVTHSVVSVGTEVSSIKSTKQDSYIQRVTKQPARALKAIDMVKEKGIVNTVKTVKGWQKKLDETPAVASGYSCAGIVVSVGTNILDIHPGDKVACGGIGKAMHAEVVAVPRNLIVKIPEDVALKDAASATIGSIAMQGVRRADVRLGEFVAVIGMGLIGQITAQILNASGCQVIGIDLVDDKLEIAKKNGAYRTINAAIIDPVKEILMLTDDKGVDVTIITAASQSDEIVQQAMEMTRKKGTVVVVGAVGLGLKRQPFYRKEIDFKISCSYGPGRYDEQYEEKGLDYPYAYVRWTENRNMSEYLRLISVGKINFSSLVSEECPIEDSPVLFEKLKSPENKLLGVILTYNFDESQINKPDQNTITFATNNKIIKGRIKVGIIGAGGFAKSVHLPNLKSLSNLYQIRAIASRSGANAKETAKLYNANYATTDYLEILKDSDIDMVLISTRHDLHARMAIEAAKAGKAILLEKPMALNLEELEELKAVIQKTQVPFMVGFNRRFSPCAVKAKEIIGNPINPIMVMYRVNAGHIPLDHWVHGPEGGGRIIGEACHMIDFFSFLTDSTVKSMSVSSIHPKTDSVIAGDNFFATLKYANDSVCSLLYTSQGAKEIGKEYIEIYADQKTIVIDNFKKFMFYGKKYKPLEFDKIEKGQQQEMEQFGQLMQGTTLSYPISIESLLETTEICIKINDAITY